MEIVLVILGVACLAGLAWFMWTRRVNTADYNEAMILQGDVWSTAFRIRSERNRNPGDVPSRWTNNYEAFLREHGGVPSYESLDKEATTDWRECCGMLLEALGRLTEFHESLQHEKKAVQAARRDNPANLNRLRSLIAEAKRRYDPDGPDGLEQEIIAAADNLLAFAEAHVGSIDADSALATAGAIHDGLDRIHPIIPLNTL